MWKRLFQLLCCSLVLLSTFVQAYEWGTWGSWSSCSETCGAGVETRERRCLKKTSASKTKTRKHHTHRPGCKGLTLDYRFCASWDCDETEPTPSRPKITFQDAYRIRAEQCTAFDKKSYNGKNINWRPYMRDHLNLCKLYCLASGHKFYARLKNMVRDGTPCGKEFDKVCVQGKCQDRPSGCRSLNGPCKVEERRKVIGVFNSTKLTIGYNYVATLPAGATNINVEELTRSRSYLALKDHDSDTYYLNGHWMISLSKSFRLAGTEVQYKRDGNSRRGGETIKTQGPLEKSLDIMLIYQRDPSIILYSFFVTEKDFEELKKKSQTEAQNLYFSDIGKKSEKRPGNEATTPGGKKEDVRLPFGAGRKASGSSTPQDQRASVAFRGQSQPPQYNTGGRSFTYSQRQPANQPRYGSPWDQSGSQEGVQNGGQQSPSWYGSSWVQFGGDHRDTKQTPMDTTNSYGRRPLLNQRVFRPNQFGGAKRPQYQGSNLGNPNGQRPSWFDNSKLAGYQRQRWTNAQNQDAGRFGSSRIPKYQGQQWGGAQSRDQKNGGHFYTSDQEGENRSRLQTYVWKSSGFTVCSTSCAGGIQRGIVKCIRSDTGETVLDIKCDPKLRPPERRRVCNLQPCPASWVPQQWKKCSKSCGEGEQMRDLMCKQVTHRSGERIAVMLPITQCAVHLRPEVVRKCFLKPCPEIPKPKWTVESWGKCSVECGHGIQKRRVICKDYRNKTVRESDCDLVTKPAVLKACYLGLCKAAWYARSEWSQCSKTCGTGIRSRAVVCARIDGSALNQRHCEDKQKPGDTQACNEHRCRGIWMTSEWSKCSSDCGTGVQERVVICMRSINGNFRETVDAHCSVEDKPAVRKECSQGACSPSWFATPWTKCSVTCGRGLQTRHVSCLDGEGAKVGGCKAWERPQQRRSCHPKQCPGSKPNRTTPNPDCVDNPPRSFGRYCEIIKRINYCRIPGYRKRCCATCSRSDR